MFQGGGGWVGFEVFALSAYSFSKGGSKFLKRCLDGLSPGRGTKGLRTRLGGDLVIVHFFGTSSILENLNVLPIPQNNQIKVNRKRGDLV